MFLRAVSKIVDTLRRDPSKLRRAFSAEGAGKIPGFIRRQFKSARKESQRQRERRGFHSQAWAHEGDLSTRRYKTYDEYVAHQRSKLEHLVARGESTTIGGAGRVAKFKTRFEQIPEFRKPGSALCLGARLGVEVEALIAMGHYAVGIDLNPGPDNRFVVTGDFHALQFADESIDCVYTNSLDHALDVGKVAMEVSRVLKPGGYFVVEIVRGYEEGEGIGEWESSHWPTAKSLAEKLARLGDLRLEVERDPPPGGNPRMPQFVLRKAAT